MQKFDKLAQAMDKHDAIFRGESPSNNIGEVKKTLKVEELKPKTVSIYALKGIQMGPEAKDEVGLDHMFEFDNKEDAEMHQENENSLPTIIGPEQKKMYQEIEELVDLVPEINDI